MQVLPRFILSPATGPLTVLAPCVAGLRLFILSIHLRSPTPRFDLVRCTGQAWIRILDLVKNQLEHTIDLSLLCRRPYRGWTRRGCVCELCRKDVAASCHAACSSWTLESDTIGLPRAAFVPSTLCLSYMRHHQVLHVLSACSPGRRFILLGLPSKPVSIAP